jgi:hypothetical protein
LLTLFLVPFPIATSSHTIGRFFVGTSVEQRHPAPVRRGTTMRFDAGHIHRRREHALRQQKMNGIACAPSEL